MDTDLTVDDGTQKIHFGQVSKVLKNRVARLFAQTTALLADAVYSPPVSSDKPLARGDVLSDEFAPRWAEIYPRLPSHLQGPLFELANLRGAVLKHPLGPKMRRLITEWTASLPWIESNSQISASKTEDALHTVLARLWNGERDIANRALMERYQRALQSVRGYGFPDLKVPTPPVLPNFDATKIDLDELIRPHLEELRAIRTDYDKQVTEVVTEAWQKSLDAPPKEEKS